MNNKKQIIYLIIFLAVILISVGGATYAYFESATTLDNGELSTLTKTAGETIFTAYTDGNIEINLTMPQMTQANISSDTVAEAIANLTFGIASQNENQYSRCTFDVVWVWDSEDRYTESDITLPYIDKEKYELAIDEYFGKGTFQEEVQLVKEYYGEEYVDMFLAQAAPSAIENIGKNDFYYPYEMSVKFDENRGEYDLSELEWSKDKKEAVIYTPTVTLASVNPNSKEVTVPIKVSIYNIPVVQNNLYNKNFKAHIEVKNVECEPLELLADNQVGNSLADSIKSLYVKDRVNDLYLHDGLGDYTNSDLEAGDGSYRYTGVNPNNYVCFGSDDEECLEDNLYRIIGVFGEEVKLIKAYPAGSDLLGTDGDYYGKYYYHWNKNNFQLSKDETGVGNVWRYSDLNNINLNTNYVNNIGDKWSSMIAENIWVVSGGHTLE